MGFKTGLGEIDKAAEEAAARDNMSFGPRLNYRNFKDKDKLILRFLTDDIITANFADWIITKRVKKHGDNAGDPVTQDFLIDPDGINWVEHYGGLQREFGTKTLISPKYRKQAVGVAVVREEVLGGGKGKTEIVDKQVILEHDGKKYKGREFILIKQSIGNFWEQFIGMTRRYDTICDRDYEVTRVGSDKETHYEIAPIDPVDELRELDALHKWYGYGRKWSDDDSDRFLYCPQTLDEWATNHSGEERAKYWLVGDEVSNENSRPDWVPPAVIDQDGNGLDEFAKDTSSNPDEAQITKFGDFKDLIRSHSK